MTSLSPLHIDALQELINIGVGKSAEVLNTLIDSHIKLHVPELFICHNEELDECLQQYSKELYAAVTLEFYGSLSGKSKLIISAKDAGKLANTFTGENLDDPNIDSIKSEVLNEIGNIILNAIMGSIVNILETNLDYVVPEFTEGYIEDLISSSDSMKDTTIISFKTNFEIQDLQVHGNILIFFEMNSFKTLEKSISNYLDKLQ